MIRVAVFASGRGSNLEALFDSLEGRRDAAVVLVASDRADAPALERARRRGVRTAVLAATDAGGMLAALERREVDWIVLAGYLKRIPGEVVRRYRNRILNIHPALLPAHGGKGMYGERVHAAVLKSGEKVSGASVHLVDEEYDRGPVVAREEVPVDPGDDPATLAARVLEVEHRLLPAVVIAAAEGRIRVEGGRAWIEEPERR
ncbi:MAG TPA: phosphoribosylglycinamide formyltransferase [Gemmatimonadota bacterium]|nr:phosphoribosylglycinamide formyltransferase [Gemmatimonadota bacterium]